jgi:chromosome segregation ATPase
LKKNKELQQAESTINNLKEKINMLNSQQKDEVDALQKTLQSNKSALDAMKKTMDNEKAFRICADEEIKNLKEQIKCNNIKFKSLETEIEKLFHEKLKIEETKNKISSQCNELIQKNISLENHCEKKDLAFDEQANIINKLENNITELKEKIKNYNEIEEENNKFVKQIKLFSKQMETYENEREVYVQRLQNMQKEENVLKSIIKELKVEIEVKNNEIKTLSEINSDLSSKTSKLATNLNNLQINFTDCLKLLDEIFENYVKNQIKHNNIDENNKLSFKFEPYLNEAFELFEKTLTEYKTLKFTYKESEIILKDELNKKENIIESLKNKISNYKQEIIKNGTTIPNSLETKNQNTGLNIKQTQNDTDLNNKIILVDEINKNLQYIHNIKIEVLPKQKLLVSNFREFMLEKIKEVENLNISKNNYIDNVHLQVDNLKKKIDSKNITISKFEAEVLKLEEKITEKDALCNEMEVELQHLRDNIGTF